MTVTARSGIGAGRPYRWTGTTARVLSVIAALADPSSSAAVSGSTSAGTGVAPAAQTAAAVGTAVNAGTMTSSPAPMPAATSDSRNASVPDATPTACR